MGSSSCHRLGYYNNELKYDDTGKYENQQGYLQIHGMILTNVKGLTIVHHGLCFDIPQNEYYLFFQWGKSGYDTYRSSKKQQHLCKKLGKLRFKQFKEAWISVTFGKNYHATNFNCNHFTEKIVTKLGFNENVRFDCSCVENDKFQDKKKLQK